jgi:hypothetical protein
VMKKVYLLIMINGGCLPGLDELANPSDIPSLGSNEYVSLQTTDQIVRRKGIENTSVSSVVSCNACAKVIFQVVAVADSVDNDDDEGCDFALTVAAGSSMMGVAEKGDVARL